MGWYTTRRYSSSTCRAIELTRRGRRRHHHHRQHVVAVLGPQQVASAGRGPLASRGGRELNGRTLWFGAELDPDGRQVWFRIAAETVPGCRRRRRAPAEGSRLERVRRDRWGCCSGRGRTARLRPFPIRQPLSRLPLLHRSRPRCRPSRCPKRQGCRRRVARLVPLQAASTSAASAARPPAAARIASRASSGLR